jgi:hypothetical protein
MLSALNGVKGGRTYKDAVVLDILEMLQLVQFFGGVRRNVDMHLQYLNSLDELDELISDVVKKLAIDVVVCSSAIHAKDIVQCPATQRVRYSGHRQGVISAVE